MGLSLARALGAECRRTVSRPAAWAALVPLPLAGGLAVLAAGGVFAASNLPGAADLAALRGVQAMTATFWPLLPLLFAALSPAQERQNGTLALLASGPLSRESLLLGKAAVAALFLLSGGLLLAAGAGLTAQTLLGGLAQPGALVALAFFSSLSLLPMVGLGLLCGVAARGPGEAGLAALGLHLLLDTAGGALAVAWGLPLLVHTGAWGLPFEAAAETLAGLPRSPLPPAAICSWLAWTVLPLALALVVFRKRDLA